MRGRWKAALAAALVLVLTGCGGEPLPAETPLPTETSTLIVTPEESREFALPCNPMAGFHPISGTNRINRTLEPLLYRGLFALDRSFQPRKDLCRSWTVSADGLTWTFRLRENVFFSDGSPLTGAEAAASLELARTSERYGARLADVTGVEAGEDSVTLTLRRPNGALPSLLDIAIVKETEDPDRPLGTGPYRITGESLELGLTAVPGAAVPRGHIPFRAVSAGDDLVYAFDAQEVSLVNTDLTGTEALGFSARLETTDYPTTTLLYLGFQTGTGPCRDEGVRLGLSQAVDRRNISGKLMAGHAVSTTLPVHPVTDGYDLELAGRLTGGQETALATLSEAGWKTGEDGRLHRGRSTLTLTLLVNLENTYKSAVADAVAQDLTDLGIQVKVEKLPFEEFRAELAAGHFDLYLGETAMTADFDPEILVGPAGALNFGGYQDEELPPLLDGYRAASGEERVRAGRRLWDRLTQQVPLAPLCFKNGSLLTQWGQVEGAEPTQHDVFAGLENWVIVTH